MKLWGGSAQGSNCVNGVGVLGYNRKENAAELVAEDGIQLV